MDMIFCARQLIEKTIEHEESYIIFVDLRKAYDSVPREAMWKVLGKYGIPPRMLEIVQSFHNDMRAELRDVRWRDQGDVRSTSRMYDGPDSV